MTRTVATVAPDDDLEHVRELFAGSGFHHLLVVDGGALRGVVSDRDLLREVSPFLSKLAERPQDAATLRKRVHQIMGRSVVSVGCSETIPNAAQLMLTRKVSCLPVLAADGSIAGILTTRDLLRWVVGHPVVTA